jgi:large subunit ribosomal protein L10
MALTKTQKSVILSELKDTVSKSPSIVFVAFRKLTVKDATDFRRGLRAEGISYRVAKKTLLKSALQDLGFAGEMPDLPGELGVAWGNDPLSVSREVYAFQKTHKDNISIVGGVFEGGYKNAESMMSIATIPPREVLIAQFLQLINSPIQRFAVVVDQIAKSKA